jgi:hypothetical protein
MQLRDNSGDRLRLIQFVRIIAQGCVQVHAPAHRMHIHPSCAVPVVPQPCCITHCCVYCLSPSLQEPKDA